MALPNEYIEYIDRMRDFLSRSSLFYSFDQFQATVFVRPELAPHKNHLRNVQPPVALINECIHYFLNLRNKADQPPFIVLFLEEIAKSFPANTAEREDLLALASDITTYLCSPTPSASPKVKKEETTMSTDGFSRMDFKNDFDPELFLDGQKERTALLQALRLFALTVNNPNDRLELLKAAGLDKMVGELNLNSAAGLFATTLVGKFSSYQVSTQTPDYHPLVNLLRYLQNITLYEIPDQDAAFFERLIERGERNLNALAARNSVVRLESPPNTGIGTGVLVVPGLILTCSHVFSKTQVSRAWARFQYTKPKSLGLEPFFELDISKPKINSRDDYTLVSFKGDPKISPAQLSNTVLSGGWSVRLIHHPKGLPAVISAEGKIVQIGDTYLDHDLDAAFGSSGAPLFDQDWQVVGLHRGIPGSGRAVTPGTTTGIPISALWDKLSAFIA